MHESPHDVLGFYSAGSGIVSASPFIARLCVYIDGFITWGAAIPQTDRQFLTLGTSCILCETMEFFLAFTFERVRSIKLTVTKRHDTTFLKNAIPITNVVRTETTVRVTIVFRSLLSEDLQHWRVDPYWGPKISIWSSVIGFKIVKDLVDVEDPR